MNNLMVRADVAFHPMPRLQSSSDSAFRYDDSKVLVCANFLIHYGTVLVDITINPRKKHTLEFKEILNGNCTVLSHLDSTEIN